MTPEDIRMEELLRNLVERVEELEAQVAGLEGRIMDAVFKSLVHGTMSRLIR